LQPPSQPELAPAWNQIRGELLRAVGEATFEIWLSALQPSMWDGSRLVVEAPPQIQPWVAKRYGAIIERCTRAVLGAGAQVICTAIAADGRPGTAAKQAQQPPRALPEQPFNPRYRFEQFVIGAGNRLAHAAALAVAELPGQAYNPLFIHAAPGRGKTHLLHAIANYVQQYGGGTRVRYATVEAFTNEFIGSLSARESAAAFKRLYRDADVLLIDDVQFLASKARTEEEFFHTFNALYESGRQLVLSCDRLPRKLITLHERLRERFESGLVVEIEPPDLQTRLTILRKRTVLDRIPVADDGVLELIATRVTDNVRALEGALIRVVAHHSLTGQPIDLALARAVLDRMHPPTSDAEPTLAQVQALVAAHFGLTDEELRSPSRAARIAWPRQLAIHLARELTTASLAEIGSAFGGRNHATVLYACRRVEERISASAEAAAQLTALRAVIANSGDDHNS
jgi:chromosomal replication initiator protein